MVSFRTVQMGSRLAALCCSIVLLCLVMTGTSRTATAQVISMNSGSSYQFTTYATVNTSGTDTVTHTVTASAPSSSYYIAWAPVAIGYIKLYRADNSYFRTYAIASSELSVPIYGNYNSGSGNYEWNTSYTFDTAMNLRTEALNKINYWYSSSQNVRKAVYHYTSGMSLFDPFAQFVDGYAFDLSEETMTVP